MMLSIVLEAAFRSLLMALAVWGCVSLLRVRAVLAQKVTWVLVLLGAAAMPLVMRAPLPAMSRALQIPLLRHSQPQQAAAVPQPQAVSVLRIAKPKPVTAHRPLSLEASTAGSSSALLLASTSATAPAQIEAVSRTVETVAASPNPPAQIFQALWQKAVAYSTMTRLIAALIWTYLAICGLLLLRTMIGLGMAFRLWYHARPVENLTPEMSADLKVRASAHLSTPVTIGSTVLLPADYREWDAPKLRIVLAHEQSHVRQRDFYLQLVATVHAAIFWFSPLGWWLQSKLSELGEALSDRAGLEQAPDAASYAQVLLEFAAMPHKTSIFQPVAGVAMARSSRLSTLSSRIDRVLDASRFRLSFPGGRRHAVLATLLVPAILLAVVAGIRFVPAVEAAHVVAASPISGRVAPSIAGQVTGGISGNRAPAVPEPPTPPAALSDVTPEAPEALDTITADDNETATVSNKEHEFHFSFDDEGGSFAIVQGDDGKNTTIVGNNRAFEKARPKLHGSYIWFERNGKSYVITDPAMVAQAQAMFKMDSRLAQRQETLQHLQAELDLKMKNLQPEIEAASKPGPEFQEQMKKLSAQLAELQSVKIKELTEQISKEATQEELSKLQDKMGEIQGQIGEIQGEIGERVGRMGEKQGELGEQMGKLGEEMGRIGEEQGHNAEEATRKLQSTFDQAIKNGKAKPVE